MKIQFALTKPQTSSPKSRTGTSYLCGLVVSTREFADFDVMPIEFSPRATPGTPQDDVDFVLSDKHLDNFAQRHKYPERVLEAVFPALLDSSTWRIPKGAKPVGEFILVKTQLPGLAQGEHAYAITGVVKGKPAYLRDICERVYEHTADLAQGVLSSTGKARFTGATVTQEQRRGLFSIPDSLHTKHVWGFSEEKYAIMAMASIDVISRHAAEMKHLIEHGTHTSDQFGRNPPPPQMLEFVREMSARGLFPPRMCETKSQTEEREKASKELQEVARAKFRAENPDFPKNLSVVLERGM